AWLSSRRWCKKSVNFPLAAVPCPLTVIGSRLNQITIGCLEAAFASQRFLTRLPSPTRETTSCAPGSFVWQQLFRLRVRQPTIVGQSASATLRQVLIC